MTKYLISFPSPAMVIPEADFADVVAASHQVIRDAKAAGVYVFGGGLSEDVPAVTVDVDGTVTEGTYPQTRTIEGGYTILELPTREDAVEWARRIAVSCRCAQELREFMFDPES